jgi:hypothetical protein
MHLTPIQKFGEKGIKSFSLAGKTASAHPGPPENCRRSPDGDGGGALREKYYWELIKNDK